MRAYKLKFISALHVDSRGSGEPESIDEFIHSDTLSAAICHAWIAINPDTTANFFHDPPFLVSSAFPYIGDVFLFPVPKWPIWKDADPVLRKQLKGVKWISHQLFVKVLSGEELEFNDVCVIPCGIAISRDEFEMKPELQGLQPWAVTERQRVSVDRLLLPKDEGLFFFTLQFFDQKCGLYFMAQTHGQSDMQLKSVLDFLGDAVMGADRNSGLGHFKVTAVTDINLDVAIPTEGWITLSLFNPGENENLTEMLNKTAYELNCRSGWISHSTLGRPPVRAFTEGSYFSGKPVGRIIQMPIPGDLENQININHPVFRDFRAISLPCKRPACLKEDYL